MPRWYLPKFSRAVPCFLSPNGVGRNPSMGVGARWELMRIAIRTHFTYFSENCVWAGYRFTPQTSIESGRPVSTTCSAIGPGNPQALQRNPLRKGFQGFCNMDRWCSDHAARRRMCLPLILVSRYPGIGYEESHKMNSQGTNRRYSANRSVP